MILDFGFRIENNKMQIKTEFEFNNPQSAFPNPQSLGSGILPLIQ